MLTYLRTYLRAYLLAEIRAAALSESNVLQPIAGGGGFEVRSGLNDGSDQELQDLVVHCQGAHQAVPSAARVTVDLPFQCAGCLRMAHSEALYGVHDLAGLSYGPAYRTLRHVRHGEAHGAAFRC